MKLLEYCNHIGKKVRVETYDGLFFEGELASYDSSMVEETEYDGITLHPENESYGLVLYENEISRIEFI